MIDTGKVMEYFKPEPTDTIVIVGCGALGSTIALNLARLNFNHFVLYDFDTVDAHNIANQSYFNKDIGKHKVVALKEYIKDISPDAQVDIYTEPCTADNIYFSTGVRTYFILTPDSVAVRNTLAHAIASCPYSAMVRQAPIIDARMGLLSGQVWSGCADELVQTPLYSAALGLNDDEIARSTPKTACGYELSVMYAVQQNAVIATHELIRLVSDVTAKPHLIQYDTATYNIMSVPLK